jgi:PAS domain S-box-containing protein
MVGTYDYRLAALSVSIAVLASYTALRLAVRRSAAHGAARLGWLIGAATAMGIGIWSIQSISPISIRFVTLMILGAAVTTALVGRLQRQRVLLDELFEQAPEAVALLTPDDQVVRVNRQFTRVFGYAPPDALGRRLGELIVPEDSREEHRRGADLSARGQRVEAEGVRQRKDGSRLHISIVRVPVSVPGGQVAVYAMFRDITERRRSEQQIHFQASLLDHVRNALIATDLEFKVTSWNRFAETLYQWKSEDVLGRRVLDLIVPDESRRAGEAIIESMKTTGYWEGEFVVRRKDGSTFPSYAYLATIGGTRGDAIGFVGVSTDITERKRAEEALREAQVRTESVLSSVADVHILLDRDWRCRYVNDAAVRALGRAREQIVGRRLWEFYPGIVGTELDRQYHRAMDERLPAAFDFHYLTADTWWQNRFYPVSEGLAVFATNITERKQAEAENARLFAQVETARERLQSLSRQLVEAQEEERRRIARELHDEIGQALTALKFNLQSVQRTAGAAVPALDESIDIAERTLQQVRNLSLDLRPSLLDDLGLAAALRWYLDRQAQRTGWRTRFTSDHPDLRLPTHLETVCFRVAQEALTNAARHAHATEVWLDVRRRNGELLLTILDDGVGFDVYATHRRALGGRSFGVLGMQERVALVGGRLDISSTPASGTGIRMSLPIAAAAAPSTAPPEGSS